MELSWIPPRLLSRITTERWLRLKVRGILPKRVAISGLTFWPRPLVLPLPRCPGWLKIGNSVISCRLPERCARCSGPHSSNQGESTCSRPYRCFQRGASHGPRSIKCPYNLKGQQLYTRLMDERTPLLEANKQLRDLRLVSP